MSCKLPCIQEMDACTECFWIEHRRYGDVHEVPLHWHDYYECEIMLSGEGEHVVNGRRYPIRRGHFWVMSTYDFHSYHPNGETELIHIGFRCRFLPPSLEVQLMAGGLTGELDEDEMRHVEVLYRALLAENEEQDRFTEEYQRQLLSCLTVYLLRRSVSEAVSSSIHLGESLAYIRRHFAKNITLEQVAARQGFSTNYFGNLFRKSTGTTFRDYLNKIRLRHACDLLSAGEMTMAADMTIAEIAEASGYSSVEYFTYVFKKKLRMTPSEYRRRNMIRGIT